MNIRRRAVALSPTLLLSSCFTMGLWGFYPESERDPITGRDEATYAYDDETTWSWRELGLRLLLTPVTLVLDCATAPVQAALGLLGDDDDDRDACAPPRQR